MLSRKNCFVACKHLDLCTPLSTFLIYDLVVLLEASKAYMFGTKFWVYLEI